MDSELKKHFNNQRFNDFPNIDLVRNVSSVKDLANLVTLGLHNNTKVTYAYPLTAYYDILPKDETLLRPDARLMDVTKFYYFGLYSWWGHRPFETFILNKTYSEEQFSSDTRLEFFKKICSWNPLLNELIIDTCNFIVTGRRDINVKILYGISTDYMVNYWENPNTVKPVLNVKQRFDWSEIENLTSQEFFSAWVSRKGGIQDLICSYKLMLGL